MKILLDECVTKKLKRHLDKYLLHTVSDMGWSGIKNGKLLAKCVENKFDILLTIDKNLSYQQNLDKLPISIVIFDTDNSKIESLLKFIPLFEQEVPKLKKGIATIISLF